jgi:hypothetical protein
LPAELTDVEAVAIGAAIVATRVATRERTRPTLAAFFETLTDRNLPESGRLSRR